MIDGDKKIIQNKSSLLEITNRLIDAYIRIKIKELDLRKKRQILLIQFQNAVNSITKRKTEYEKLNIIDMGCRLNQQQYRKETNKPAISLFRKENKNVSKRHNNNKYLCRF